MPFIDFFLLTFSKFNFFFSNVEKCCWIVSGHKSRCQGFVLHWILVQKRIFSVNSLPLSFLPFNKTKFITRVNSHRSKSSDLMWSSSLGRKIFAFFITKYHFQAVFARASLQNGLSFSFIYLRTKRGEMISFKDLFSLIARRQIESKSLLKEPRNDNYIFK